MSLLVNKDPKDIKSLIIHISIALLVWHCIAYIHLMTGYLDTLSYRPDHKLNVADYLYYFLAYSSWALLSVFLYRCLKAVSPEKMKTMFVFVFILGLLLWLPIYFGLDYTINALLNDLPMDGIIEKVISTPNALLFFYAILYALTFGVCTSILMYKNAKAQQLSALKHNALHAEAQLTLARQQLQLLQSQLSPHFLFNCLGAISALVRTADKEQLLSAVSHIGSMLRFTVSKAEQTKILLSEELEFIQSYIALQQLRFAERFSFDYQLDKVQHPLFIPPLLIQPLIENAFTHGVAASHDTIIIELVISQVKDRLCIQVTNDLPRESNYTQGMQSALSNLEARLEVAFTDRFDFDTYAQNNRFVCCLEIPVDADE